MTIFIKNVGQGNCQIVNYDFSSSGTEAIVASIIIGSTPTIDDIKKSLRSEIFFDSTSVGAPDLRKIVDESTDLKTLKTALSSWNVNPESPNRWKSQKTVSLTFVFDAGSSTKRNTLDGLNTTKARNITFKNNVANVNKFVSFAKKDATDEVEYDYIGKLEENATTLVPYQVGKEVELSRTISRNIVLPSTHSKDDYLFVIISHWDSDHYQHLIEIDQKIFPDYGTKKFKCVFLLYPQTVKVVNKKLYTATLDEICDRLNKISNTIYVQKDDAFVENVSLDKLIMLDKFTLKNGVGINTDDWDIISDIVASRGFVVKHNTKHADQKTDENSRSSIMYFRDQHNNSILLTGDAEFLEKPTVLWAELLAFCNGNQGSFLVVLPHHGAEANYGDSKNNNLAAHIKWFEKNITPAYYITSSGDNKGFKHPSYNTVAKIFEKEQTEYKGNSKDVKNIYYTWDEGYQVFILDGESKTKFLSTNIMGTLKIENTEIQSGLENLQNQAPGIWRSNEPLTRIKTLAKLQALTYMEKMES